ncbi:hypothetical protein PV342_39545, partial [Streptomyces sp. PA03-3a]|nr:hypothetical protein [Streptomyces sp. PA03-3a]
MSAAVRGLVAALLADAGDGGWPAGVPRRRRAAGLLEAAPSGRHALASEGNTAAGGGPLSIIPMS